MAAGGVNIATKHYILRLLLFFALISTPSLAKWETTEHGSKIDASDISNLIIDLQKRYDDNKFDSYSFDNPGSSDSSDSASKEDSLTSLGDSQRDKQGICENDVTEGSIIKATDSLNAGAGYVDSIKGTNSNADCQAYCCKNSTCDVAVYQDKGDRYCYLFRCEGKCLFKDHAGYLVNTVTRRTNNGGDDSSSNNNDNNNGEHTSETDLESLSGGGGGASDTSSNSNSDAHDSSSGSRGDAADATGGDGDAGGSRSEPASSEEEEGGGASSRPADASEPVISQHSVSLSGYCTQDIQCEDTNAGCHDNNCRCGQGFYNKEGICRTVCAHGSFECFELGTITRGPDCVPRSQVCDSYMQCADGSDEFNCDAANDFPSGSRHEKPSSVNKATKHPSNTNFPASKHGGSKSKTPAAPKSAVHQNKPARPTPVSGSPSKPESDAGKSAAASAGPNPPPLPSAGTASKGSTSTDKPAPPASSRSPPLVLNRLPAGELGSSSKHLFVASSREKVIIASPGGGNAEGPIVALSLGLALTLVLLIMVVCRLRGVKHRLRKGRPLSQNEADYLINGMYL